MKYLLLLWLGLFACSSFADDVTQTSLYDPVLDDGVKPFAVELSVQAMGDYGSQPFKNFSSQSNHANAQFQSTDGLVSITGRKMFTREFDLSFTAPIIGMLPTVPINGQVNFSQVSIHPFSLGARYHLSYFSDLVLPFAQVDLGEAYVNEYDYSGMSGNISYLRPFAKITGGADIFVSQHLPFYLGIKVGYLVMQDFGSLTTGVDVGYTF